MSTLKLLSCPHLLNTVDSDGGFYKYLNGRGFDFNLSCPDCHKLPIEKIEYQEVSEETFLEIQKNLDFYGWFGAPEVKKSEQMLKIEFDYEGYSHLNQELIMDIEPFYGEGNTKWIAVSADGKILRINKGSNFVEPEDDLKGTVNFTKSLFIKISKNSRYLAVANTFGENACVYDLIKKKICLELKRDDYHIEHSKFPLDFAERDGKTLLVHGTDWNRLDVTDVESGKLLTTREFKQNDDDPKGRYGLDYFHADLMISPDDNWILENGWAWHPVGIPVTFNLRDWLKKNVWESESGPSRKTHGILDYWPSSACWINDDTLALCGLEEDYRTSHGVRLIDVQNGKCKKMIPADGGKYFFDRYFFVSNTSGFSAWNVETAELMLESASFHPRKYHRELKQFLSWEQNNMFRLGRILN